MVHNDCDDKKRQKLNYFQTIDSVLQIRTKHKVKFIFARLYTMLFEVAVSYGAVFYAICAIYRKIIVCFSYSNTTNGRFSISNIDMDIRSGQRVAIVGENGDVPFAIQAVHMQKDIRLYAYMKTRTKESNKN